MTDFDTEHGSVDFLDLLSSGSAQDDADSRLESVAFACLVNGLADERAAAILAHDGGHKGRDPQDRA